MASKTAPKSNARTPRRNIAGAADGAHLYLQVAHALKGEIMDGLYPVGSQLPAEQELRARFSVSRYTIREALKRLRDDNLISSRQGAGTIVAPRRIADVYAHDVMSINDLVSWSVGKRFAIEFMELVELDEKTAARAGLESGREWLVVKGFGYDEGVKLPACWAEYYIHREFSAVGRLLHRHVGPIFPLIEDMFGQKVVEVDQDIGATLITPALANALKAKAGGAALEIRRAYKTPGGDVIQVTLSTYPAARFRHSTTLRRVKG